MTTQKDAARELRRIATCVTSSSEPSLATVVSSLRRVIGSFEEGPGEGNMTLDEIEKLPVGDVSKRIQILEDRLQKMPKESRKRINIEKDLANLYIAFRHKDAERGED